MQQNCKITFVNAKINLGLNIIEKRPDGYHNLQSIFYPIGKYSATPPNPEPFGDVLEVWESERPGLTLEGIKIDGELSSNLIYKAMNLFSERYERLLCRKSKNVEVKLLKNIPLQAGLGGGSADASFMLKLLNEMHDNIFSTDDLLEISMQLGADCPFFIFNKPAIATGIGESLAPLPEILSGKWALIVKPNEAMSTPRAFSMITPRRNENNLEEVYMKGLNNWKYVLTNDFEMPFFTLFPHLQSIKDDLYTSGAVYASLSGSGSAFFGIFENKNDAIKAMTIQPDHYFKTVCLL